MNAPTHIVRLHIRAAERRYTLQDDHLVWTEADASGSIRLEDVARIDLNTYLGLGSARHRQCDVTLHRGERVRIRSHHFVAMGAFEDRTATYAPLIRSLCGRVAELSPTARFRRGGGVIGVLWFVILILIALGLALCAFALTTEAIDPLGAFGGMAILATLGAVSWREAMKNTSASFDPANPPADLLGFLA